VLAGQRQYATAFAVLLIPAVLSVSFVVVARLLYPRPEDLELHSPGLHTKGWPRAFWFYLAGTALVGAGFADFSLMSYHFEKVDAVADKWIPIFYAIAMGTSGLGSLIFGRLFDRIGIVILVPLTVVAAAFVPFVFLGGFWLAMIGCALWGIGTGVHESIAAAAIAPMVPPERRASAYGLFTAAYGVFWFLGSAVIGMLYDLSLAGLIGFSVAAQVAAVPFFVIVARQRPSHATWFNPEPTATANHRRRWLQG
jgi:predicted MFS family arabinose efflux permease